MRSLLKKTVERPATAEGSAWHPDFRNVSRLPDTKTVRTKFFVNLLAVTATLALLLFVGLREMRLAGLRTELATIESHIATSQGPSGKALAAFKAFQAEEKAFNEAYGVVQDAFSIPDFLLHLGALLPQGVRIQRVEFRGASVPISISGSVRGLDAAASDVASEFVKLLQADEKLKERFVSISLTNLGRNVAEGNMSFELSLAPIPAKTPPPKK